MKKAERWNFTEPEGWLAFPELTKGSLRESQRSGIFDLEFTSVGGMSLRDYFAGQALSMLNYHNILMGAMDNKEAVLQIINAAVLSYRLADGMIEKGRDK